MMRFPDLKSGELYSAWYYYQAEAALNDGVYALFSNRICIKTNWLTPGTVPNGKGIVIHTVRLLGLEKRIDELDERNWLCLKIAGREDTVKIPPWVLYDGIEVRLPTLVSIPELVNFFWKIHIDAAQYSLRPDERKKSPPLTLIMGVQEFRSF
jgi:hypothetical protein